MSDYQKYQQNSLKPILMATRNFKLLILPNIVFLSTKKGKFTLYELLRFLLSNFEFFNK